MPDESDPPRKFYGFKPRDFERANAIPVPPPAATAPVAPDPGILPSDGARIDVRDLNHLAATGQPLLSATPASIRENEIHGVLRENLAIANAAGLNDVTLDLRHRTPRQRRIRRFWILLPAINVPLGLIAFLIGPHRAMPFFFVCTIATIGFLNARLIWHTFFLNTD